MQPGTAAPAVPQCAEGTKHEIVLQIEQPAACLPPSSSEQSLRSGARQRYVLKLANKKRVQLAPLQLS